MFGLLDTAFRTNTILTPLSLKRKKSRQVLLVGLFALKFDNKYCWSFLKSEIDVLNGLIEVSQANVNSWSETKKSKIAHLIKKN